MSDARDWPLEWLRPKGHHGKPAFHYTSNEVNLLSKAPDLETFMKIHARLRPEVNLSIKEILNAFVKSINPAVKVPLDATYTGEMEIIINVPCRCEFLAYGHIDNVGNNVVDLSTIKESFNVKLDKVINELFSTGHA